MRDQTISAYALPGLKGHWKIPIVKDRESTLDAIESAVCQYYGVKPSALGRLSRLANVVMARHVTMYFMRKHTSNSLVSIGKRYRRDHTTVIHAVRHVKNLIETDEMVKYIIENIERKIA